MHDTKMFMRAALLLSFAVSGGNLAQAQSCSVEWTGNAGNGSWSTPGNWSPSKVPGPTSDVCILNGTADGAGLNGSSRSVSVHSIQVGEFASLLFGSGTVSIATSLTNNGFMTLFGTKLSAPSIDVPGSGGTGSGGEIDAYDNSSITSPAFSNNGTLSVGAGATLRLADNPVQLQNGTLSAGSWQVSGVLIVPSDISQITSTAVPFGTVVSVDAGSVVQDASGNNALATLTSVGPTAVLGVGSLTIAQDFTSQGGIVNVGSLTVNGTYTQDSAQEFGGTTRVGTSLSATSVIVGSGSELQGGGTVASSITNNGTVAPQGTLTVTGNYIQAGGATLLETFGSNGSSTLSVKSNATLSGALKVQVNPKHPPASGATYTALTFGSLDGSFTSVTAGFTLTTTANSIVVRKQ